MIYVYGTAGASIEQINNSSGTVLYLHHDQQGSTRLLTGSTGKTEGSYSYSAYGTPEHTGTATTPLGYDGQYTSSDTGLVYMRNRVYDPSTAQFLTVDPTASVTRAPYSYAGDNPVNERDRTGLAEETIDCYPWGCFSSPGGSGNSGGEVVGETIAKNWHEFEGGAEKIGEEVGNIWNEITSSGGQESVLRRDKSSKIHTPTPALPTDPPAGMTREELEEQAEELDGSIAEREKQAQKYNDGHPPHRERIEEEERYKRRVEQELCGL